MLVEFPTILQDRVLSTWDAQQPHFRPAFRVGRYSHHFHPEVNPSWEDVRLEIANPTQLTPNPMFFPLLYFTLEWTLL